MVSVDVNAGSFRNESDFFREAEKKLLNLGPVTLMADVLENASDA